jgi:hypothetical protein
VAETGDGAYDVTFSYRVLGGRVFLPDGESAARVTVSGGVITEMSLVFRRYEAVDEVVMMLPERQTLAAAGGEFGLGYYDAGDGLLEPYWYALEVLR